MLQLTKTEMSFILSSSMCGRRKGEHICQMHYRVEVHTYIAHFKASHTTQYTSHVHCTLWCGLRIQNIVRKYLYVLLRVLGVLNGCLASAYSLKTYTNSISNFIINISKHHAAYVLC